MYWYINLYILNIFSFSKWFWLNVLTLRSVKSWKHNIRKESRKWFPKSNKEESRNWTWFSQSFFPNFVYSLWNQRFKISLNFNFLLSLSLSGPKSRMGSGDGWEIKIVSSNLSNSGRFYTLHNLRPVTRQHNRKFNF
jgi:hypothetical protein